MLNELNSGGKLCDLMIGDSQWIGGSAENVMRIVYDDLGLDPDPQHMAGTADWMHDYVGELFAEGLPWCAGAREMLDALSGAGVTMALVTNTRRGLTEKALNSIGRDYFTVTVCGDEVPVGKPAPDIYLHAAAALGLDATECLAIEDSVTGTTAAEDPQVQALLDSGASVITLVAKSHPGHVERREVAQGWGVGGVTVQVGEPRGQQLGHHGQNFGQACRSRAVSPVT